MVLLKQQRGEDLGAIIGYGLGQALPFLAFITIGKRMRKIMPNGNTLTQFVLIRFGKAMFRLVLLLTIMYMFVYLAAEVTAIAKVVNLMSGFPSLANLSNNYNRLHLHTLFMEV